MNCDHSVTGYCNKCAADLIAENQQLKAKLDARPQGFINLHEVRKLRKWHWEKFAASKNYTRTNPATKAGVIALHAEAVRALNEIFEPNDRLHVDE